MLKESKEKPYLEVLWKFRQLIESDYHDGGWLPPVREISKRFNVSPGTYRKAVKCLLSESVAESFPRKGIYIVPKKFRVKKIGVILRDGHESPFIQAPHLLTGIIDNLCENQYQLHILQGNPVDNIIPNSISHYINGLIWLYPSRESHNIIKNIIKRKLLPLLVMSNELPQNPDQQIPENIPFITENHYLRKLESVDILLKRGHRKFGYVGSLYSAHSTGLVKALKDRGIYYDDDYCTEIIYSNPGKLRKMIVNMGITALIIEGNSRTTEKALQELNTLPKNKQPEIICRRETTPDDFRERYPNIKIAGLVHTGSPKAFSKVAVKELLNNLKTPENLKSIYVKNYKIEVL